MTVPGLSSSCEHAVSLDSDAGFAAACGDSLGFSSRFLFAGRGLSCHSATRASDEGVALATDSAKNLSG